MPPSGLMAVFLWIPVAGEQTAFSPAHGYLVGHYGKQNVGNRWTLNLTQQSCSYVHWSKAVFPNFWLQEAQFILKSERIFRVYVGETDYKPSEEPSYCVSLWVAVLGVCCLSSLGVIEWIYVIAPYIMAELFRPVEEDAKRQGHSSEPYKDAAGHLLCKWILSGDQAFNGLIIFYFL